MSFTRVSGYDIAQTWCLSRLSMTSLPRNFEPIDPFTTKDDLQFEGAFRLMKQEVLRLVPCLRLPPLMFVPKLGYVPILTALMVLLHRLHNPVTFIDMEETFGIPWYNLSYAQ